MNSAPRTPLVAAAMIVIAAIAVPAHTDLFAATIHVPGDAVTIQAGLDASAAGDTVLVGPGTWRGVGNVNLDFMGKDLVFRSVAGAAATTIDCEGGSVPPVTNIGVYFHHSETAACVVEGFTFDRGEHWLQGGGLRMEFASPTVRDCVFRNSRSTGVVCIGSSASFTGCSFLANHGGPGAGIHVADAPVTLVDCVFEDNVSLMEGGGVAGALYCNAGVTATRCAFRRNAARDLYPYYYCLSRGGAVVAGGDAVFTDCEFTGNIGCHGGAVSGTATLVRCTFSGNDGGHGGDVESFGCLLESCTLAGATSRLTAAVECYGGLLTTLDHTIIAFSALGPAVAASTSNASLVCSDLFGNAGGDWTGTIAGQYGVNGNFTADPLFCNRPGGDLQLDAGSPCLDAPGCGRVGALGAGCPAAVTGVAGSAREAASWGLVKVRYRRP